jgi:hypothetical protein
MSISEKDDFLRKASELYSSMFFLSVDGLRILLKWLSI